MFGNSNQNNNDNQFNDIQAPEIDQSAGLPTAPSLPTMGGQNSPFGNSQTQQPSMPAPQADPVADPLSDDQNQIPHHEDTDHMVTDHGTPDPLPNQNEHQGAPSDLVDIKQQALSQLSPLVPHLDQSAEEKFRTTMMMIQATDDQSLLKTAYESAQKIEDDKVRAQALLDVINEINYFTQQSK